MANDILQKDEALKQFYPNSKNWHRKVDKMSEAQIVAVYIRMTNKSKI